MFFVKNKSFHLFFISFLIYIFLNLIENFIHYNIGRHSNKKNIELSSPTKLDLTKIIIVMIIFAFLQGFFTYLLN